MVPGAAGRELDEMGYENVEVVSLAPGVAVSKFDARGMKRWRSRARPEVKVRELDERV